MSHDSRGLLVPRRLRDKRNGIQGLLKHTVNRPSIVPEEDAIFPGPLRHREAFRFQLHHRYYRFHLPPYASLAAQAGQQWERPRQRDNEIEMNSFKKKIKRRGGTVGTQPLHEAIQSFTNRQKAKITYFVSFCIF